MSICRHKTVPKQACEDKETNGAKYRHGRREIQEIYNLHNDFYMRDINKNKMV